MYFGEAASLSYLSLVLYGRSQAEGGEHCSDVPNAGMERNRTQKQQKRPSSMKQAARKSSWGTDGLEEVSWTTGSADRNQPSLTAGPSHVRHPLMTAFSREKC